MSDNSFKHAWVQVRRRGSNGPVVVALIVESFESMFEVSIAPDDWSKMLAEHGKPVEAEVRLHPRDE